jgi:hypothetical protein
MRQCTGNVRTVETIGSREHPKRLVEICDAVGCPRHFADDVPNGFPPGYEPVYHAPYGKLSHVTHYIIDPGVTGLLSETFPKWPDGSPISVASRLSEYRCSVCGVGNLQPYNGTPYRRSGGKIYIRLPDDVRFGDAGT